MDIDPDRILTIRHTDKTVYCIQKYMVKGCHILDYVRKKLLQGLCRRFNLKGSIFSNISVVFTERVSKGPSDILIPKSDIFFYQDDIETVRKRYMCGICIETRRFRDTSAYVERIYCLGFIETKRFRQKCGNVVRSSHQPMFIQGHRLKKPFFLVEAEIFNMDWKDLSSLPTQFIPEVDADVTTIITPPTAPMRSKMIATRNEPTIYLYIVQSQGLSLNDVSQLYGIEKKCLERLDILWMVCYQSDTQKNSPILDRARDSNVWHHDRVVIYVLMLIMCWDEEWREWYLEAEKRYVGLICENMVDADDFIITLEFNCLSDRISFFQGEFTLESAIDTLEKVQEKRINTVMKIWKDKKVEAVWMERTLVDLMDKVFVHLNMKKLTLPK